MSDVTLYFHIGATKTGTTAIQRFMEQNSARLRNEYGVLYPNLTEHEVCRGMQPGRNYYHGHYFENTDGSRDVDLFNECIACCRKNSLRAVVVSYEGLLNRWQERLGAIADGVDANVKIICYVRRQDHHLESAWKQIGYRFCSSKDLLTHSEGWGGWRQTNWYRMLAPWAKKFGKQNIIVRPYESEQLPDGIFLDFLRAMDIPWTGSAELTRKTQGNPGLSRDVLEFLYLNRDFYSGPGDQRLYGMLLQLLDERFLKEPFEQYGILSPADRIQILKENEADNQKLAREYLHREDGRLFYEPWPSPDDPWEPYEGLTVERLVPIMTTMMYKLYQNEHTYKQGRKRAKAVQDSHPGRLKAALRRLFNWVMAD